MESPRLPAAATAESVARSHLNWDNAQAEYRHARSASDRDEIQDPAAGGAPWFAPEDPLRISKLRRAPPPRSPAHAGNATCPGQRLHFGLLLSALPERSAD